MRSACPTEFRPRDSFACTDMVGRGTHNQPAGTWSDDTSMALALCDTSYRELGDINCDDILVKFRKWINEGAYTADGNVFDYGNATRQALDTGCGLTSEYSKGNGSLMRCLPMVFMECSDCDIREVSAITHATDDCCGSLRGHDRLCPRGALQRARRLRVRTELVPAAATCGILTTPPSGA